MKILTVSELGRYNQSNNEVENFNVGKEVGRCGNENSDMYTVKRQR